MHGKVYDLIKQNHNRRHVALYKPCPVVQPQCITLLDLPFTYLVHVASY